jgi:hypothetical protein
VAGGISWALLSNATRAFNSSGQVGNPGTSASSSVVAPSTASGQVTSILLTNFILSDPLTQAFKSVQPDVSHRRSVSAFVVCDPIIMGICRQLASILEVLFERFGFETSGFCRTSIWWGDTCDSSSRHCRVKLFPAVECTVVPDQKIVWKRHVKGTSGVS